MKKEGFERGALVYANTYACMEMFLAPSPGEVLLVLAAMAICKL